MQGREDEYECIVHDDEYKFKIWGSRKNMWREKFKLDML